MLILALLEDGQRRAHLAVRTERKHGEVILGHIDTLLGLAGTSLQSKGALDAVAATLGPGGFTALRVGLSTAKGLAMAHDLPIYGVGSLTALAHGAPGTSRYVAPVIGAYKGEVFAAVHERTEDGLVEVVAPFHAPPEEAHARVREVAPEDLGYVGPGARKHEVFRDAPLAALEYDLPSAAGLAAAVLARLAGEPDDLTLLEPHYVRPSDAVKPKGL